MRASLLQSYMKPVPQKGVGVQSPSTNSQNFLENRDEGELGVANETVEDILNDVLRRENFQLKQSGSSIESHVQQKAPRGVGSAEEEDQLDMDPRLRSWNRMLEQRRRLQARIERETGKRPEDVLFNRSATIDEASKRMILRVLDTADRSRPVARLHQDSALDSLKLRRDPELCREIRELYAAKPNLKPLEFVGLPRVTQRELTAPATESQWQRSQFLGQRIQSKKQAIQQVLEFAPDLEKLQVVPTEVVVPTNTEPITMLGVDLLLSVSGDSLQEEEEQEPESDLMPLGEEEEEEDALVEIEPRQLEAEAGQVEAVDLDELPHADGVMINGTLYEYHDLKGVTGKGIHLLLKCDPHQRLVKPLVDIQNLSQKLLHVYWASRSRFKTDRQALDAELIFDRCEFILEPLQRRVIRVLFQPQEVGLITQRYSLCCVKSPFCGTRRLEVVIQGQCTMPAPFQRRLEGHRQGPVDKQQRMQAHSILHMQASLAPIIENPPLLCPYQRALDERELFNAQNPSYRCERYADLEALKDLHALAKKPRDRSWDLSIEDLRHSIGRQPARFMREKLHNRLVELLQPMKCTRSEALIRMEHNPERDRACFIYVRGTISSAIDEWEKMALGIDDQFFKLELLRYAAEKRAQREDSREQTPKKRQRDHAEEPGDLVTVDAVSKKVRANKYLKDSLYVHTYNLLCDAAEDIVSVIESTSHL